MKLQFKLIIMILITSLSVQAQTEKVYSKTFETDKSTTAIFNLENTTVAIEESTDGKVHFDYSIKFEGYSKKEVKSIVDAIKVEATMFENNITLQSTSVTKIPNVSYKLKQEDGLSLKGNFFNEKKDEKTIERKSKDSIIKELSSVKLMAKDFFEVFIKNFKEVDTKGNEKSIGKSNFKIMRSLFVIKLPSYVKLKINGKDAQITFKDDITNEMSVVLKNGFFTSKQLLNSYNKFKIDNASFKAEGIVGGDYNFINIGKGLIGSVQDAKIASEFSKIEIGEIAKGVTITDFNSEYHFYNWTKDFKRFDLYSEYSKIHYFYPEDVDYSLKVVGNNTVNYVSKIKIEMQPTRNGEKFNMMERKPKGEGAFAGSINFDIIHGIIYSYSDSFTKTNH